MVYEHTSQKRLSDSFLTDTYVHGVRHVRDVRPNRAADFRGRQFQFWHPLLQVAQLSQRGRAAVWVSCGPNITLVFRILWRLLLQLRLLTGSGQSATGCNARCANGWFTSRTIFAFKGMSPTNYMCTEASKCLTTLPLTVSA